MRVFFPDDAVAQELEELVRFAGSGGDFRNHPSFERVRRALRNSRGNAIDAKELIGDHDDAPTSVAGAEDGTSIREILEKAMSVKFCLQKNLGW